MNIDPPEEQRDPPSTESHFRFRLLTAAREYLLATGRPLAFVRDTVAGGLIIDVVLRKEPPAVPA